MHAKHTENRNRYHGSVAVLIVEDCNKNLLLNVA